MSDRDDARRLLRELLHDALANGSEPRAQAAPSGPAAPVPAPPVAAVLRPSTWDRPPEPGEVIGDGTPAEAPDGDGTRLAAPGVEWVSVDSDEDLDRFARALASRCENPRERRAIQEGALRFALRRAGSAGKGGDALRGAHHFTPDGGARRIERGAVTERTVKDAAAAGARLILAPGAVLTPLAREKARALGIEIERERRC